MDPIQYPAPGSLTLEITFSEKLIRALRSMEPGVSAVALKHVVGAGPNLSFVDHRDLLEFDLA